MLCLTAPSLARFTELFSFYLSQAKPLVPFLDKRLCPLVEIMTFRPPVPGVSTSTALPRVGEEQPAIIDAVFDNHRSSTVDGLADESG